MPAGVLNPCDRAGSCRLGQPGPRCRTTITQCSLPAVRLGLGLGEMPRPSRLGRAWSWHEWQHHHHNCLTRYFRLVTATITVTVRSRWPLRYLSYSGSQPGFRTVTTETARGGPSPSSDSESKLSLGVRARSHWQPKKSTLEFLSFRTWPQLSPTHTNPAQGQKKMSLVFSRDQMSMFWFP